MRTETSFSYQFRCKDFFINRSAHIDITLPLYSAMKREQGTLEEDSGEAAEEDAAASEAVDGVDAADSKVAASGVTEEADGEKKTEQVDYRDFDIFKAVKEAGITTICLDEAHHLRSEWWKALETFFINRSAHIDITLPLCWCTVIRWCCFQCNDFHIRQLV